MNTNVKNAEKYLKFIKDSVKKATILNAPPAERKNRLKESVLSAVAEARDILPVTVLPQVHAAADIAAVSAELK